MLKHCGLTCVLGLKGGVGKSSLVLALYQYLTEQGMDVGVVSNDPISRRMEKIVADSFLHISRGANFPAVKRTDDLIFDFGGFPESRAYGVLGNARNVLLPTLGDSVSIEGCIESLRQVEPLTQGRIAVIASRVTDDELALLQDLLSVPVFRLKNSMGIPNMFAFGKSLKEQITERPVLKVSYNGLMQDIKNIANWLMEE